MEEQEEKKPAESVDIILLRELNAVCKKLGIKLLEYQFKGGFLLVHLDLF